MSPAARVGVYAIPAGRGFLRDLARGLADAYPPEILATARIYLPTRRACRSLVEAFLELPGSAGLLPVAHPLGDVDGDDMAFLAGDPALAAVEAMADLPPAIQPLRRAFLLATLARAKSAAAGDAPTPLAAGLRLADALGRFLDELAIERVDPQAIRNIDAGIYAAHWGEVLAFLEIVLETWPNLLAEIGQTDAVARREALLDAQAALWSAQPPDAPLIVAGSTGAQTATRALMRAALQAPRGAIVLPGFDPSLPEDALAAIREAPTHPLHAMATTLASLGVAASDVEIWPGADPTQGADGRRLADEALRPAATIASWDALQPGDFGEAPRNLIRVDAPNEDMEARAIAIFLREAIETPETRAALVTPDRALALRVAAELRRWGVEADDSGGQPLSETAVGAYLRLATRAFSSGAGAVDRLAFLKHPFAAGGRTRLAFRVRARALEARVWRDRDLQRFQSDFTGAAEMLKDAGDASLARFAADCAERGAPFATLAREPDASMADLLRAHIELAEAFAATDAMAGADILWRDFDGEAAADLLANALTAADAAPPLSAGEYADAFDALLAGAAVRRPPSADRRVAILGVLEARLQGFDAVALGGLDEGVWPRQPPADPWFSRAMRREVGLSDPDRRIGLSAHDFAQHLASPSVLLSRSLKRDGAPTKPSRWLARLDAALAATGARPLAENGAPYLRLAEALDPTLDEIVIPDPAPRPPVAARPRQLPVTRIKTLRDDPYSVYARDILRLRPLQPLDPPPTAADRGTIVHDAFERFLNDWPDSLPDDVEAALAAAGEAAFAAFPSGAAIDAFWRPAFQRAAAWAAEAEPARRARLGVRRVAAEVKGEALLDAPGGVFTLQARADRVDLLADGSVAIVDVKTGAPPSMATLKDAREPQLPLEAAIVGHGKFGDHAGVAVRELAIWKVGAQSEPKIVAIADADVQKAQDLAWDGLAKLIGAFDSQTTPYLSEPDVRGRFNDYRGLARRFEDLEEDA